MKEDRIFRLALQFREAIEKAKRSNEFEYSNVFFGFPCGCCRDTSDLLAAYLYENGIRTMCVSGGTPDWTHAWLIEENDYSLKMRKQEREESIRYQEMIESHSCGHSYLSAINAINSGAFFEYEHKQTDYLEESRHHLVIDITGDQFKDKEEYLNYNERVYVGEMDAFHSLFEISSIYEYDFEALLDEPMYSRIMRHIK